MSGPCEWGFEDGLRGAGACVVEEDVARVGAGDDEVGVEGGEFGG
jgi:hypothetical protein